MFKSLFDRKGIRNDAEKLYAAIVERTRTPVFYEEFGVADTVEGRFELLTLHTFLILKRLKRDGEGANELSQATFDIMFENVDLNLREVGIGDIGLARRIKKMAEGFFGRVDVYERAMDALDSEALKAALARNLFSKMDPSDRALEAVSRYVIACSEKLAGMSVEEILSGQEAFAALPGQGN